MIYRIKRPTQTLRDTIKLPASKSISNRMLILNALSYSTFPIKNLAVCDDTQVLSQALQSDSNHFDIGAAGTSMRFLTAFLSKIVGEWTITGSKRMLQRPIGILVDALRSVGAQIDYLGEEGYPPLRIKGSALQGGEITLQSHVSSQYISALLMISPLMEKGLILHLEGNLISRPYIALTLDLMQQMGISYTWKRNTISVNPGTYTPIPMTVESDWTAASYWYAIMALAPNEARIKLLGLYKQSAQGDAEGAHLAHQIGVGTQLIKEGVALFHTGKQVERLDTDFTAIPDLAQTFVVLCLAKGIPFHFTGLQSLKIKETNRIAALITEAGKLGFPLTEEENGSLHWEGSKTEADPKAIIQTYDDHRMAMAFAPYALVSPKGILIDNPSVVNKSYPNFWADLRKVGFEIEEIL